MQDEPSERPSDRLNSPDDRAREKYFELKMFAELAAVFEGTRKFEAQIDSTFDAELARDVQKRVAKLDKLRIGETGILQPSAAEEAAALLLLPVDRAFSTNDYHVYRRPGETMILRWLAGDEVDTFYTRLQAHLDAGLGAYVADERANTWKNDAALETYLTALEGLAKVRLEDRWRRGAVRDAGIFALSTQTADEMNIAFLAEQIMGASPEHIVSSINVPTHDATETDLAWFFKLFMLRGTTKATERMCFFAYLQKTDDTFDVDL
jgi:hypothetical protein